MMSARVRNLWRLAVLPTLVIVGACSYHRSPTLADQLCKSAFEGNSSQMDALLKRGAPLNESGNADLNPDGCNCRDDPEPAPDLVFASFAGHDDIVQYLISRGADVMLQVMAA